MIGKHYKLAADKEPLAMALLAYSRMSICNLGAAGGGGGLEGINT